MSHLNSLFQAKLALEQRRCSELTAELAEVEGRLAGLNGQLSVTQAEGAEYVGKYSAAKSEVAGLSRQLEEVRG
jgi:chromosome segregation ATPase